MVNGKWQKTVWTLRRRYCKKCDRQETASPEDVLPRKKYGIFIIAQVAIMHSLGVSFGIIQDILEMTQYKHIHRSILEDMCNSASDVCRPVYEDLRSSLADESDIGGDETGWFIGKKQWWAWVFASTSTIVYCIAPTRGRIVAEAILKEFQGILLSDSHSGWYTVGSEQQKCLLHYFRNMYTTLAKNKSDEFREYFDALHGVLKKAIALQAECNGPVPEIYIRELLARIDELSARTYKDKDCKRFAKRLRRERNFLFTFLRYPIEYHNNRSERALRRFAVMRKVLYGNRSLRGAETTETLSTILATCRARGVNPYTFLIDLMRGRVDSIPAAEQPAAAPTAAAC